MLQPLVILGTGGSAFDLLDLVEAINAGGRAWNPIGFLDDARPAGSCYLGLEVLGRLVEAPKFADCSFVNTIGSDKSYRDRAELLASTGLPTGRFATMVHPAAFVSPRATLGRGVVVNPGVVIGGGVSIGDHVTVSPGCIVGHETSIGAYSILAPGAVVSGLVNVDTACYVGAKAVIRQKLRVGTGALIGMGAVVIRDVEAGQCVIGNPARPIDRREAVVSSNLPRS